MWVYFLQISLRLAINSIPIGHTGRYRLLPRESVEHNIDNPKLIAAVDTTDTY